MPGRRPGSVVHLRKLNLEAVEQVESHAVGRLSRKFGYSCLHIECPHSAATSKFIELVSRTEHKAADPARFKYASYFPQHHVQRLEVMERWQSLRRPGPLWPHPFYEVRNSLRHIAIRGA